MRASSGRFWLTCMRIACTELSVIKLQKLGIRVLSLGSTTEMDSVSEYTMASDMLPWQCVNASDVH